MLSTTNHWRSLPFPFTECVALRGAIVGSAEVELVEGFTVTHFGGCIVGIVAKEGTIVDVADGAVPILVKTTEFQLSYSSSP